MSLEFPFYPFVPDSNCYTHTGKASKRLSTALVLGLETCAVIVAMAEKKQQQRLFTRFFPGLYAGFIAIFETSRVQSATFYPNIDFFFFTGCTQLPLTPIHFLCQFHIKINQMPFPAKAYFLTILLSMVIPKLKTNFLSPHFQLATLNS